MECRAPVSDELLLHRRGMQRECVHNLFQGQSYPLASVALRGDKEYVFSFISLMSFSLKNELINMFLQFIFPELNQNIFKEKFTRCSFTKHLYSAAHIKK